MEEFATICFIVFIFLFGLGMSRVPDNVVTFEKSGEQMQINYKNQNYLMVPCSQTTCE